METQRRGMTRSALGAMVLVSAILAFVGGAGRAAAQCAAPIMDDSTVSRHFTVNPWAVTVWDADGAGPGIGELVVSNGTIGVSRGGAWRYITDFSSDKVTTFDPDREGPLPTLLLSFGAGMRIWDGASWTTIPTSGLPGRVTAAVSWDKDGPGGQAPTFVVASAVTEYLTSWNEVFERVGSSWSRLGTIKSFSISLAAHDPDGSGPKPEELFVGGGFSVPGPSGMATHGVLRWSGSAWSPPGDGVNNVVTCLASWDRDGNGPIIPYLVAGGDFTASGANTSVKRLAKWNGASWTPVSAGSNALITALGKIVLPDSGQEALVVGGQFTVIGGVSAMQIATYDGSTWRALGEGLWQAPTFCTSWRPNGPLSDSFEVFTNVGHFDGSTWTTVDEAPDVYDSRATCVWDPDASGPRPPRVVMTLEDGSTGEEGLLTWDGREWTVHPLGFEAGALRVLLQFDPDGVGPAPSSIVFGGSIWETDDEGVPLFNNIGIWDGESARSLGDGLGGIYPAHDLWVSSLVAWDRDGSGPEAPTLIAAGEFKNSGSQSIDHIASWDGEAWQQLAAGLSDSPAKMLPWDPDGSGPLRTQLLVAGNFAVNNVTGVSKLAMWDGTAWNPFPGATPVSPSMLTIWDPDGTGPTPRMPLIDGFGSYDHWCEDGGCGSTSTQEFRRWDGFDWKYASGTTSHWWCDEWGCCGDYMGISELQLWDADGAGPRIPMIAMGGQHGTGSIYLHGNDEDAYPFDVDVESWYFGEDCHIQDSEIHSMASFDPDGTTGPVNPILIATGYFDECSFPGGRLPASNLARFMDGAPGFLVQPRVLESAHESGVIGLEARALGPGTVTYQWYKDGTALATGPAGTGAIIHEARAPTLVMSGVTDADDGEYWCVASNACGGTESDRHILSASGGGDPCGADHNADTVVDILDLLDFVSDFSACEGLPAPCGSAGDADRNGDTVVDILDFLDFIGAFSGGCD